MTIDGIRPHSLDGLTPKSPLRKVDPVLVTVEPPSTAKLAEDPRLTMLWLSRRLPAGKRGDGEQDPVRVFHFTPVRLQKGRT